MRLLGWMSDVNDIYFNRVIINQFRERKVLPVPKWIQVDLLRVSMWKSDRISFLWLVDVEKGFQFSHSGLDVCRSRNTLSMPQKRLQDRSLAPINVKVETLKFNEQHRRRGASETKKRTMTKKLGEKLLHNQMSTQWTIAENSTIFFASFHLKEITLENETNSKQSSAYKSIEIQVGVEQHIFHIAEKKESKMEWANFKDGKFSHAQEWNSRRMMILHLIGENDKVIFFLLFCGLRWTHKSSEAIHIDSENNFAEITDNKFS